MENLDEIIGKRLAYFINKIGMSKGQFADRIGFVQSNLSHYLQGNRSFSSKLLENIYNQFPNLNPEWLEQGTGQMLRQISNFQSGNLFGFEDENHSNTDIYSTQNDIKSPPEILQNKKNEQEIPKKSSEQTIVSEDFIEKMIKKVIEGISEKQIEKKIKQILIFYDNGTFDEARF